MSKSKEEVQAALGLNAPPDDAFMALLAKVGDADVINGPPRTHPVRAYEPDEIEKVVLEGVVGSLLAHARDEAKRSLSIVGAEAGISRARVQQIEHSNNIEVATLVRVAAACGYQVGIRLEPLSPGMRVFSTILQGATR
jgi:DNA-binding phage protein